MKQKLGRKLLSFLLALAMVLSTMTGIVPGMSMTAQAEETTDKTVAGLGTSAIGNPTSTESTATAWAGSYVYYGKYDGTNPTMYRVLDKASADFGVSGGSLLLDCNTVLYSTAFGSSNAWASSSLRSGLQGDAFLSKEGVFTDQEKAAIAESTKSEAVTEDGSSAPNNIRYYSYVALDNDTVFVLDANEVSRASYGYASSGTRKKNGVARNRWWLRSVYTPKSKEGSSVSEYGGLYDYTLSGSWGVCPAFNVSLSSVIFSSEIPDESGSYKLTLKDDALGIAVTSGKKANLNNNQLTIPYTVSGDNSTNATQVSVLVTDKAYTDAEAQILKYGKLADVTDASLSGKAKFRLPEDLTGTLGTNYHIYLLAEDVNGEKETDYAGLKEITADDVTTHEHSFTYTASGATITATCTPTDVKDVCTLENKTATLTIAAPQHTAVGDGKSAEAQITDENQLKGSATVSYYATDADSNKTGSALGSAPTNAGTYWAEITLGTGDNTATAHVVYTITDLAYTVTIPDNLVGGTVAADKTSAKYGETVTLDVTHDNGFTIKTVKYNDTDITANGDVYSFTMPASNVTVSATFEGEPFGITTEVSPANGGTVEIGGTGVVPANNVTTAKAGSEVTLTVNADTGFTLDSVTVKKASGDTVTVTDNKFIMPTEAVTVSATFVGKDTTATLDVTGNSETTCTAKLLDADYKEVESVTKKGGEQFILLVNRDEGYDFNAKFGSDNASLTEFTEDEYKAYVAYAKDNNITLSSNMVLAWVTMPGVTDDSVTLTVAFSKLQTFTVLYQPGDSSTTAVWCKFAVNSGVDGNNTASSQMKSDATMGDGSEVYSLKVTAAFAPTSVAFAATKNDVDAIADNNMTNCSTTAGTSESDWTTISSGKFCVIGGDAKTVIVAFVSDASNMAVYNSDTVEVDEGTGTGGVTYRVAIVNNGSAGTVKAPANTLTKEGYNFAGWRGFEGTAPDKKEKIYKAGDSISVSENTTLNAVWNLKKSTVTLNLNGGTGNSSIEPVTYGGKLPTLENPTRSGFAFDGWTVSEAVTENGKLFAKGSPFDLNTPITANLKLTAQWKHVHSYTCYQISSFPSLANYQRYNDAIHVAVCGCNDIQLMAHEFDENGKCACGYQKPGAPDVKLNISYGQWSNRAYTEKMKGMPETAKQGQEVSICAPDAWGDLQFSKWQYSTDSSTWYDLTANDYVSFLIPATMYVRALYVNPVTVPQVDLSARQYDDHTVVNGKTYTMDNILFQMNYKLPDGYTFVDSGIRLGDNAGISYYELKERTWTANSEAKALVKGFAALGVLVSVDPTNVRLASLGGSSETETFYEVHKNSVLDEMTAAELAKHMYESKPINVEKYDPIYWEAKAKTKGMSGSMATLPPLRFAQKDNQDHWIYGIGWLRYKDKAGNIQTIYTEALATTVNGVLKSNTGTVTKSGS